MSEIKTATGWAWLCNFGLCKWVEPEKRVLIKNGKPSPEAVPVYVRIVRESDWRKLGGKS